jgi:hypothetical protein
MQRIELIVIGGSAGSLHPLLELITTLGDDFPLPLLVVLHRNSLFESSLELLFSTRTNLLSGKWKRKNPSCLARSISARPITTCSSKKTIAFPSTIPNVSTTAAPASMSLSVQRRRLIPGQRPGRMGRSSPACCSPAEMRTAPKGCNLCRRGEG